MDILAKIKKNEIVINSQDIIIKTLSAKTIVNLITTNNIIIPPFQRPIDNNVVDVLVNDITQDNNLLCRLPEIQFTNIEKNTVLYIIDGQHRLKALEKLNTMIDISNIPVRVHIQVMKNIDEIKIAFCRINTNTKIHPNYIFFEDEIKLSYIKKIHEYILDNYNKTNNKAFHRNDGNISNHMTKDEFLNYITIDTLNAFITNLNIKINYLDAFIQHINRGNEHIKQYLGSINNVKDYIQGNVYDQYCQKSDFYLQFKNTNLTEYLRGECFLNEFRIKCIVNKKKSTKNN